MLLFSPLFLSATDSTKAIARFWSYVDKASSPHGCWLWTGCKDKDGYGQFSLLSHLLKAHRFAWFLFNGEIEYPLLALHACPGGSNATCCNPDHLYLGTAKDNAADTKREGRLNTASGVHNGSKTHPERMARGDRHGTKTCPGAVSAGLKRYYSENPGVLRGSKNRNAKLTEEQVRKIRASYATGFPPYIEVAKRYGVSEANIRMLVTGATWKHVQL